MTLSAREVAMKLRDALGLAIMYVKGDQLANVWANYPELPERTLLQVLEDAYAATLPPEPAAVPEERLRALLEGLECEEIENLMQQRPEILRAVGVEIGKAAKLGAHLYAAAPKPEGKP